MKSKSLKLILAIGLMLFPTHSLQASVDSILTLDLKCYVQKKITPSGTTETGVVETFRLDSKQLLELLQVQLVVKYPNGSELKVATDGKVYVTDSNGVILSDVSRYLHAEFFNENQLFDGKYNKVTGEEKSEYYYPMSFTINLAKLKGTVKGIVIEKFKVTSPDKYGVQNANETSEGAVNGSGLFNGNTCFFDGKLKLKGKAGMVKEP